MIGRSPHRSRRRPNETIRLMKWIVLIALIVLLLLALFLPDRGLAARDEIPLTEQDRDQLSSIHLPTASSTPSENRMRRRLPSISKGTIMRASS